MSETQDANPQPTQSTQSSDEINPRLGESRHSPSADDHERPESQQKTLSELEEEFERLQINNPSADDRGRPELEQMTLSELEEEFDKIQEEIDIPYADRAPGQSESIARRYRELMLAERAICRFPSDHSEEVLAEADIQNMILNSENLPRFLFRGSNGRSGGNDDSDSERSQSSDDGNASSPHKAVRMINSEDRIVPHAHLADPQLLNHPKHQTLDQLRKAVDYHTSARQFNTPFTSWTCDFETAVYFAIGHYPNGDDREALRRSRRDTDWMYHDTGMPAQITVLDTRTITNRHLRVFHQPTIRNNPDDLAIQTEFLLYGALDRADGIHMRTVSIQDLRARLSCRSWPRCPFNTRNQHPHRPTFRDVSDAWTIARAFMQDGPDGEDGPIDMGLVVLAAELSRQQWAGFAPRPDIHILEGRVQVLWPEAWMRRIRSMLQLISPDSLGTRMSGISLANAGTPYVGFPQFRLMQQLLLAWVLDYPFGLTDDDDLESERRDAIEPLPHNCEAPTLLASLTDLELALYWSQMVRRDRDGDKPVPPPREYDPDQGERSQSSSDVSLESSSTEEHADDVHVEDAPAEEDEPAEPNEYLSAEDRSTRDHADDVHVEDAPAEEDEPAEPSEYMSAEDRSIEDHEDDIYVEDAPLEVEASSQSSEYMSAEDRSTGDHADDVQVENAPPDVDEPAEPSPTEDVHTEDTRVVDTVIQNGPVAGEPADIAPIEDARTGDAPVDPVDSTDEATVQTQQQARPQQPERAAQRPIPAGRPYLPQEPQWRAQPQEDEYQQWGDEVPVTIWNVIMLLVVFPLVALYFLLVLAVY